MDELKIIAIIVLSVVSFCLLLVVTQKISEKAKNGSHSDNDFPEYETVKMKAKVIDLYCLTKVVGIKNPKSVKEFFVCFENDNGEVFNLAVSEEIYDGFEQGQTGLLSMVENELYGFEPDEN